MFSGSYMRRWNDKLRPVELYEIDKQAHKMIVAWMLTLLNSGGYSASDQLKLQQEVIERGLFDYLYRLVTTDIKPPVFYRICENEKDYKELTSWVHFSSMPITMTAATFGLLPAPIKVRKWRSRSAPNCRRP